MNTIKKIAKTKSTTVLLLGESGTGKDMFAQAIHNESDRNKNPFVTINCSSLVETLLESELFGHEKGAFTDAKQMKKGLFEVADGGTVFLDEIGEINQATQIKLLGVLENRVVRRLGGTVNIPVDIRVVAATNKDLKKAVEEKTFREDLYYRLKVFQITLPSLRERKEDLTILAEHFINYYNVQFQKNIGKLTEPIIQILKQYDWPGNIRELRNVMERAVILESLNTLQTDSLPTDIASLHEGKRYGAISRYVDSPSAEVTLGSPEFGFSTEGLSLYDIEKQLIKQALQKIDYNQTKAAELLGISRDTLRYKIKKYLL